MKRILVATFALLAGCSSSRGNEYSLGIDHNFRAQDVQGILDAADMWHEATGTIFHPYVGSCDSGKDHVICVRASTVGFVVARDHLESTVACTDQLDNDSADTWLGADNLDDDPAYVNPFTGNPDPAGQALKMRTIAAHELGHAMGLQHEAVGNLMEPNFDPGHASIMPVDVAQWKSLR